MIEYSNFTINYLLVVESNRSIILLRNSLQRGTNISKPNPEFALNSPSDSTRYSQSFGCNISSIGDTLDAFKHHVCAALAFNNTVASYKSLSAFVSTRYILSFVFMTKST